MRLPAPLLRRNPHVQKNDFGHVLVWAGSPGMLGAAALCGLSAMRAGSGLVTLAVAKSLNLALQKKISPVIMTMPLPETSAQAVSLSGYQKIKKIFSRFQSMVIGPGLDPHDRTLEKVVLKCITECPVPLVIDARALSILSKDTSMLGKAKGPRILTPHLGEMCRLTGLTAGHIQKNFDETAKTFARQHRCVLVLKSHRSVVVSPRGEFYRNNTGNAGMATAGSGDVLAGMIAAFLGQGIGAFEAAKFGCYLHGKAGDRAAKRHGKASLIASDLIDHIAEVILEK
jgi:ADP-dependent NAD(P)H-hydrate dehydratase / NAD(P)H-hydrate epimerase